ncbi:hypothetical protein A9P82_14045 [Arachidicoccus ginsenosidimutans]|uniref:hypothetical protein n=1 Tax=Arachidicoccus sp. BS20 TaxID=1850526 RepID=UPI0007F0FFE8|nr:hypothetical protein [Arachidicoccus sp. BS20]ANI90315.1 hypothetical protein A9P82_14045 [Arachidicoccus sp. BS20]
MKKFVIILSLFVFPSYLCQAQDTALRNRQKVEEVKRVFFTRQLKLTVPESKAFWPIYNRYDAEIRKAWQQSNGNKDVFMEKAAIIKDNYRNAFANILHSHERANDVYKAERTYRIMLKNELKGRDDRQHR